MRVSHYGQGQTDGGGRGMAIEQRAAASAPWRVRIWIPDETETNKVPGSLDHNSVGPVARDDLLLHARRNGLTWLIWEDTQLGYRHESGVRKSLYPDIMVAREVQLPGDASYEIEAVGKAPELVIEILSDATSGNDKESKMTAYAQMGVSEYVLFDPRPRDRPLLGGYQLAGWGRYEPIRTAWGGGIWLGSLGLRVVPEPADEEAGRGPLLRFFGTDGVPLPHLFEEAAAKWQLERAWVAEQRARVQVERTLEQVERTLEQTERALVAEQQAREQAEAERETMRSELARLLSLLNEQAHSTEP